MLTPRLIFARLASFLLPLLLLAGAVQGQTPEDVVHSFAGQKLLLRALGDHKEAKLKKKDLAKMTGTCDLAVEVTEASWERGKARFRLVEIGSPYLPNRPRGVCKRTSTYDEGTLELSGFAADEKPEDLTASIGQVLQTPEQYLSALGVPFDLPRLGPEGYAGTVPERVSQAVTAPRQILGIDPTYSEEARQAKFQADCVLWLVIGPDGRVHDSRITRQAGYGLEEHAMNVLPLWRFEPARKDGKPVAVQLNMEVYFHLY